MADRGTVTAGTVAGVKRQHRTKLERRRLVEETLAAGTSVSAMAQAHGVRASQLYHWRRLYRQGLLESESGTAALVPVRIADPERGLLASGPARGLPSRPSSVAGTIHLELDKAHLRIEGTADPCSLRVLLEYLLG